MSGLKQFTPPSVKGMNFNIDADLDLGSGHGLYASWVRMFSSGNIYAGSDDIGGMGLHGGSAVDGHGAVIGVLGSGNVFPGRMYFTVPNAAKNLDITTMQIAGVTDTPYLDLLSHRIAGVATPTTDNDALPYQAWAAATLTHTWSGATPASWSYTFRYMKIGKTCFYSYIGNSTDSNATTGLVISVMPYTAANTVNFHGQWMEGTGAGGTTFNDAIGYVPANNAAVQFLRWVTPTDGQPLYLQGTGFYEVA